MKKYQNINKAKAKYSRIIFSVLCFSASVINNASVYVCFFSYTIFQIGLTCWLARKVSRSQSLVEFISRTK